MKADPHILIIDAGAQYGKVINRRVEELGLTTLFLPIDTPYTDLLQYSSLKGAIISGGPNVGDREAATKLKDSVFKLNIPVLGICYGAQIVGALFGSNIEQGIVREDGQFKIQIETSSPLFKNLASEQEVLITHGAGISALGQELVTIASSDSFIQGIQHRDKPIYGLQFHPEVDLTKNGHRMMRNFCYDICGITMTTGIRNRQSQCIAEIKEEVGSKNVLALLSGGVDSTVLAVLLTRALGPDRVLAIHVDNGLMRKNESHLVVKALQALGLNVQHLKCGQRFLNSRTLIQSPDGFRNKEYSRCLCAVMDPEIKRRIIGDTFINIVSEKLSELDTDNYVLAQGTLAPDLIESGSHLSSSMADTIKTHHNDSPLAREFRQAGKLIEPLKTFHKDEVRELGRELRIPSELINRHPFPGPGLAPRILCQLDIFPSYTDTFNVLNNQLNLICSYYRLQHTQSQMLLALERKLSDSNKEFLITLENHPKIHPVLLPVRTVGVQGDQRTYSFAAGLTVEADDSGVPWEVLFNLTKLITMLCSSINRCCYIFGDVVEPPIRDITPTTLSPQAIEKLRECDAIATHVLGKNNCFEKISQMPVVLLPLHFDRSNRHDPSSKHSIVLRPFITNDFMTGRAAMPGVDIPENVMNEMVSSIQEVIGISRVMIDLTSKPPGTTEWE